jgi:cobalt-zinc-cadmium efflux system membrane fusion protein
MKARTILPAAVVAVAVGVGAVLGATVPQVARTAHWLLESIAPSSAQEAARGRAGGGDGHAGGHGGHAHAHGPGEAHAEEGGEGSLTLTAEQIEAAGIRLAEVGGGTIARRVTVPGTVAANADRLARVPARVAGIVAELRRRPGDQVAAGEVLAVVESREIAEAKADYLAALRTEALARTTAERERRLWERRVTAEQDHLKAQAEAEEARIRLDLAQAKLAALGLGPEEIAALRRQPLGALRRQEIHAPLAGRVIERRVALGAAVAPETETFVVADLSVVWVEMAIAADDLAQVHEGQDVVIAGQGTDRRGEGRVIFISPVLDAESRTARAVAEFPNPDGAWRPGAFVSAAIATDERAVDVVVPPDALQTMGGETVVFVRTAEGFERREVVLGRRDERGTEVVFGLDAGETIAVTNTFVLKAELGKSEAAHGHAH